MDIGNYYISKQRIIIFVSLLLGLVIAVYLVQTKQIFKSKAALDLPQALQVTQTKDGTEQQVNCDNSGCTTESLDIQIKVKDLERLVE